MTFAPVAGGEETAGIHEAHEVGDPGAQLSRHSRPPRFQLPGNSLSKDVAIFFAGVHSHGHPGVADDGSSADGCPLTQEIDCQIYSGEFRHSGKGEGGEVALENLAD
ncbi:hypothetical protein MRX96_045624 [Rhipicephalus microplus]